MKTENNHFRVNTPMFLKEILDNYPGVGGGAIRVPILVFRDLLTEVAQRCTEINDPVLDRLMFDLALYDLPSPTDKKYGELMNIVYENERNYLENKK
jgi:hypothetical protein